MQENVEQFNNLCRRQTCVCVCVCEGSGGCMHVGMHVLVYLCKSTEGTGGREGERGGEICKALVFANYWLSSH